MPSRRSQKVAEAIREVVSMAILAELNDPRVQDVTVTYVEVSGDLRRAKVHVSVMGDESKQKLSLRGLQSAAGFLQSRCAARIDTRYTPRIEFVLDQGVKKSIAISEILDRVLPREETSSAPDEEADAAEPVKPDQDQPAPSEARHPPPDGPNATPDRPETAS
ncbi:MAG: 30S ribosome-binding factor RbfA [Planctomycetota bacterium]